MSQLYLKEKTKVSESKDITTDTIVKCLKLVDYSSNDLESFQTLNSQVVSSESRPSSLKNLQFKLFILIYITQNGSILKQVDDLNILPFLLRSYGAPSSNRNKAERDSIDDVILSILANMAFEEKLREKINMLPQEQMIELTRQALESIREYSTDRGIRFPAEVLIVRGAKKAVSRSHCLSNALTGHLEY